MNNILNGVYLSAHPDPIKVALYEKVINNLNVKTLNVDEINELFGTAKKWVLLNGSKEQHYGLKLLSRLAPHFPVVLNNTFPTRSVIEYVKTEFNAPLVISSSTNNVIHTVISLKHKTNTIFKEELNELLEVFQDNFENPQIPFQKQQHVVSLFTFFIDLFYGLSSNSFSRSARILQTILLWLSNLSVEPDVKNAQYNEFILGIIKVIKMQWGTQMSPPVVSTTLFTLFVISSQLSPFPALGNVLHISPASFQSASVISILSNTQLKEKEIEEAISHIAMFPLTSSISGWVMSLLNGLMTTHKFSSLASITLSSLTSLLFQLYYPPLWKGAFKIFECLLLGFQHSPEAFHMIVPLLPDLLRYLGKLIVEDNVVKLSTEEMEYIPIEICQCLSKGNPTHTITEICSLFPSTLPLKTLFIDLYFLIWTMIHHHTGYPEIYTPLIATLKEVGEFVSAIDGLKNINNLNEDLMKKKVSEGTWLGLKEKKNAWDWNDTFDIRGRGIEGKGGLINQGNTCYMNSFLQVLYMTDPFCSSIISFPTKSTELLGELQRVFSFLLLSQRHAYTPKSFSKSLPLCYRSSLQQDASEFGKFLLDSIDTFCKRCGITEYSSLIPSIFGGYLKYTTKCLTCNFESTRKENFLDLCLPFSQDPSVEFSTIQDMLQFFLSPEKMEGENKYFCEACNEKREAIIQSSISSPSPTHLVLTLNRFAYNLSTRSREKICKDVKYSEIFYLPVENETSTTTSTSTSSSTTTANHFQIPYVLYGVIMHSGRSAEHGHYYSYVRSSKSASKNAQNLFFPEHSNSDKNNNNNNNNNNNSNNSNEISVPTSWYLCNDSVVQKSSFESFTNITSKFPSDVPYMLFYARIQNNEEKSHSLGEPSEKFNESNINLNSEQILVPDHIKKEVIADNQNFLVEIEQRYRNKNRPSYFDFNRFTPRRHRDDDFDGNNGFGGFKNNGGGGDYVF